MRALDAPLSVVVPLNFYYPRGGDTTYALSLEALLASRGHRVIPFATRHERSLSSPGDGFWVSSIDYGKTRVRKSLPDVFRVVTRSVLSAEAARKMRELLEANPVDVAHLQNVHFHLTPSILYPLSRKRVPVVWTLHDYSILCPAAHFLSQGTRCEACKKVRYYQAVLKRCKEGSLPASGLAALASTAHRVLGLFRRVDRFIAPSRFLLEKFVEFGFPREQLVQLGHFLDHRSVDPGPGPGQGFVYAGRLSREKGVDVLLRAAARRPELSVQILGEGPQEDELRARFGHLPNVRFHGHRTGEELARAFRSARAVVVPSECYENFPLVILEAYAHRKPVVCSRLGALPELVDEGNTGLLFTPGEDEELGNILARLDRDALLAQRLGASGRELLEREYGPEPHYRSLLRIYREVIEASGSRSSTAHTVSPSRSST